MPRAFVHPERLPSETVPLAQALRMEAQAAQEALAAILQSDATESLCALAHLAGCQARTLARAKAHAAALEALRP